MTPALASGVRGAAQGLAGGALLLLIMGWSLGWSDRLGLLLYGEQMLALALGLCAALLLLADGRGGPAGPGTARLRAGLAAATLAAFGAVAWQYPAFQAGLARPDPAMIGLAAAALVCVLLAVWHRMGPVLPLLLLGLAGFALWIGPDLPGRFATRGLSPERLAVYLAYDTNGLLSRILHVAVITIAPFILFGALLEGMGAGVALTRPIARLVGGFRGGAAKVSVLSSAGFGTLSGSAVANVSTVGAVTIPMMRRAGHPPHQAAAIEAVSSTGGQLMPPIMGASAFLMADLLGVPYSQVALAALGPALLYFAALLMAVDFAARRHAPGPAPLPPPDAVLPPLAWRYALPAALLVYLLFFAPATPGSAALVATAALLAVHLAWPLRDLPGRLRWTVALLVRAARLMAEVILLAAAAALVLGLLNVSGAAFMLSLQVLEVGRSGLGPLLAMTALLALLLGLGMPTVGVYVLVASLAAPALVAIGVEPMAAHLYALYFGMLSMITPPIAMASFAAALVAEASQWKTALRGLRFGAAAYAIPVVFVLQPALLTPQAPLAFLGVLLPALLGLALLTAALFGHVARPLGPGLRLAALGLALGNLLAGALDAGGGEVARGALMLAGLALLGWAARSAAAPGGRGVAVPPALASFSVSKSAQESAPSVLRQGGQD